MTADPAAPLAMERIGRDEDVIKAPIPGAGVDIGTIHYFGASVLLPQFRGQGIGHRFFDEREAAARAAGADCTAFCAVVREKSDPQHPDNARESEHLMRFWIKKF